MEKKEKCKTEKSRLDGWIMGEKLEKRYLLGDIYRKEETYVIWHAYDEILGISCLLLRERKDCIFLENRMAQLDIEAAGKAGYQILRYRSIDDVAVLIFSMKNSNLPPNECKILEFLSEEGGQKITEVNYVGKKEAVLPENTILENNYRVLGPIGIGGFGITYLCEDINLGRNVAVKEYFPAQWAEREECFVSVASSKVLEPFRYGKKAFIREIKTLAQFIHEDSVVTIFDGFAANDTFYMAMEYLPGKSLGKMMKERQRPFLINEWEKIMDSIWSSLEQLHARGILHGDISPGNVFCTNLGEVKLIDLGAAKKWKNKEVTFEASFLKPEYASPEQFQTARTGRTGTEGPWTDIYSFGATMYYCLTGRKPPNIIKRLEEGEETILFSAREKIKIKRKWRNCICKCMELDRKKRPQSIRELRETFGRKGGDKWKSRG